LTEVEILMATGEAQASFLSDTFLERLGIGSVSSASRARLEKRLLQLLASGRKEWPRVHVKDDVFARYVADRLPGAKDWLRSVEGVDGGGLYLACACAGGDLEALAQFERHLLSEVPKYVARLDASPEFAEEVRQALRQSLFVPNGSPAKILQYSGSGSLGGWLRVVAVRTARNLRRGPTHLRVESEQGIHLLSRTPDPEVAYLKARSSREFREAFQEVLASLSDKERNVLALHVLDGMSSAAIGRSYRVHGATVRLWIKRARETLLRETVRLLTRRLQLTPSELTSFIRLVQSQIDLTLSALRVKRAEL
jgi:RNA polymerase sigma-70 factor (ECF subfamily)